MGAVANKKQFEKIRTYIEIGKKEGKLIFGGQSDDSIGYFVKPTIFKDEIDSLTCSENGTYEW